MGLSEGSPQSTWSDLHPLNGSPLRAAPQQPPSPKRQSLQLLLCRALRERDLTHKCLCGSSLLETLKSFAITQKQMLGFPGGSDGKESTCDAGDQDSIPGLGRFPGEGNSYSLQYSCLGNSKDRGAWQTTLHGVSKKETQVSD